MSTRRTTRTVCSVSIPLVLLALSGCDNVGRAFDPNKGGGGGANSTIAAVPDGGVSIAGRPKVRNVFPKGNGWPGTVPIVVVFNETIAPDSVQPSTGTPNLFVQLKDSGGNTGGGFPNGGGTTLPTPVAASYDFLLGGRVVIIRPNVPFDPTEANTYEVIITSELTDADSIRFGGSAEKVIATFTADKSDDIKDGEILTVLPVDNARDQMRQSPIYAIFTKPATQSSVVTTGAAANFRVRAAGGADIAGTGRFPIRAGGFGSSGQDGRIFEFEPGSLLVGGTRYEIVVAKTISFAGSGELDFRGRTPYAKFDTMAAPPATSVVVGNPAVGAADKVNANNIATLRLDVALPAEVLVGDLVKVRIYGLHVDGGNSGALDFFEAQTSAPASGAQTVVVDFAGKLGTAAFPRLLEGPLQFAAQLQRRGLSSGYVLSSTTSEPALDVTVPTLDTPVADVNGDRFVYTDQEHITFFGTGNENLSAATLVLDSTPAPAPVPTSGVVFGLGSGGRFMFEPVFLGRRTSPVGFSLTITDAAGNESPPFTGTVVQRGVVTGSVAGGTLVVEAFDDATFQAVSGVTVMIEPGLPTATAVGRQTAVTGADGRAIFTGLVSATHSITLVRASYHLVSLIDTAAGFASLPMRPESKATSSVRGTAAFNAGTGQSAMIGCNILDDVTAEEIKTTTTAATTIPATPARPNRPYILTALGGTFEPTGKPTFVNFACSICGLTAAQVEAAREPIAPGGTGVTTLALLPATNVTRDLAATYTKDLATWTGLDPTKLDGDPTVRVMTSLFGMPQMTLTGVGFASQVGSTTTYTIDATYSIAMVLGMDRLFPKFWVSTEATDTDGVLARHRRIIFNTALGVTFASAAVPAVATITAPAGASTDSPAVTYQDRLDAATVPSSLTFQILTVTSGTRTWRIIRQDKTGASGATTLQLPVFSGVLEPGLATGTWKIRAETHQLFSLTMTDDDFVLEEMRREEITYARTPETDFIVN